MTATFYLGTHKPHWLWDPEAPFPLFVSIRTLRERRTWKRAKGRWALDSGGFTELAKFGTWMTPAEKYVAEVSRAKTEIGSLDWAAPQDWMCEPSMLEKTGLTVLEHQRLTIANFRMLNAWMPETFIPVLQGWELEDYFRCMDLYRQGGVNLDDFPIVGVGSVCRRGQDAEVERILWMISEQIGPKLHAFGVRSGAFARSAMILNSADSMAWSYDARRTDPLPGHTHASCSNCMEYAKKWRDSRPSPRDHIQGVLL